MGFYQTCQHVKANGELCGSPALRRQRLCYFHFRMAERERRRLTLGGPTGLTRATGIELPLLEDPDSIQVALTEILNAIVDDRIDPRRASLLLYGLQIASSNQRNTKLHEVHDATRVLRDASAEVAVSIQRLALSQATEQD